jgi:HEPN domain-containing protein/predicted nucleotidyltransferase
MGFSERLAFPDTDIANDEASQLGRICGQLRQTREEILGIILFGSLARGESHHDVDMLVVVDREGMTRKERDEALITLRRALGSEATRIDLAVVDKGGLRWGLKAHYPFYLDVAFDGVVLYDAGGITDLLEQARREVEGSDIRRTETGGWQFPVPYRQRVPLSPHDNITWAQKWIGDGQRDLEAADVLLESGLFERSVTHSQQTVEKSVKAVLACMGRMERTHYLSSLLLEILSGLEDEGWRERLEMLARAAEELEPAAVRSRYPVEVQENVIWPSEQYDENDAERAINLARRSLRVGRGFVRWWIERDKG